MNVCVCVAVGGFYCDSNTMLPSVILLEVCVSVFLGVDLLVLGYVL